MGQTGQCLCGAVSYETTAEPLTTAICHCKNCQRQAGSVLSVIVGYPADGITVKGTIKTYEDRGTTGQKVYRQFCPECGSPMFSDVENAPQMRFIKAGTFDDTSWLEPQIQFWSKSKQNWYDLGEAIPHVEGNPPG